MQIGIGIGIGFQDRMVPSSTPPTGLALSNLTINESDAPMTVVGSLTATAPADIITWSLTDSAGGVFAIGGQKRDQIVLAWKFLDRSVATSYNITVVATGILGSAATTFTITIAAVTTPAGVGSTPILAGHFQSGVTLSGSNIVTLGAAWGATGGDLTGHAALQPDLATDGPSGQNYAKFNAGEWFDHTTTGNLSVFDATWVFCYENVVALGLLSSTSNTANLMRLTQNGGSYLNRLAVAWADVTTTNVALSPELRPNQWHKLRITYDAAGGSNNLKVFLDGALIGQGTAASKTMASTQLGRVGTAAPTVVWRLGAFVIFPAILSAGDATIINTYLQRWSAQRRYVSTLLGSDASLTPWKVGTPLQTIAAALNDSTKQGTAIILSAGEQWNNQVPVLPATSLVGTAAKRWYFGTEDSYTATPAKMYGGQDLSLSVWTDNGNGTWNTAVTNNPGKLAYISNADLSLVTSVQNIVAGTPVGNDWQFSWAAGVVTASFTAGFNPNGKTIWATNTATTGATGWNVSAAFLTIGGVDWRYWSGVAAVFLSTTGSCAFLNVWASINFTDGLDCTSAVAARCDYSGTRTYHNGIASDSTNGDGHSHHGNVVSELWDFKSAWNGAGGVRGLQGPSLTLDRGWVEGNGTDLHQLSSLGQLGGSFKIHDTIVRVTARSTTGNAFELDAGLDASFVPEIFNCVFHQLNTGVGVGIEVNTNQLAMAVKNTVVMGFATGEHATAGGSIVDDYNCLYNNTLARSGASAGAHSITSNPLFVDAVNGDYRLQAGSPCLGAGVNLGLFADYVNRRWNTTPDIGAYES